MSLLKQKLFWDWELSVNVSILYTTERKHYLVILKDLVVFLNLHDWEH